MLAIFAVFFVVLSFASPYFLTTQNIMNVMSQVSSTALLAIGMTIVIITSGIDLSVGATLGLSGMVGCMVLMNTQNVILGVAVILVIGMLVGLVNGVLIGYLQLPAFIVTLGTMQICRSLDYVISNANTASKFPEVYSVLGKGKIGGFFPVYILFIFGMFAIFIWIMGKTKFGRFLYAIGSNAESARLTGINVKFNIMMAYVISGLMCGLGGLDHDQPSYGLRRHLRRRHGDGRHRGGRHRRNQHERRQGHSLGHCHRCVPGGLPAQRPQHSGCESLLAGHCDRRGDRGGCAGGEIVQAQSQKDHKIKGGT